MWMSVTRRADDPILRREASLIAGTGQCQIDSSLFLASRGVSNFLAAVTFGAGSAGTPGPAHGVATHRRHRRADITQRHESHNLRQSQFWWPPARRNQGNPTEFPMAVDTRHWLPRSHHINTESGGYLKSPAGNVR